MLARFCGLSAALHAACIAVLLLLAQPVPPLRLGKTVEVQILQGAPPGARGQKPASPAPRRPPTPPRAATRPPVPPRLAPRPNVAPRMPPTPIARPSAPPDPSTVWVGKQKLKPAPLPELQPEEASREAKAFADTLTAPTADPVPPAPATEAPGAGAGSAGTGEGADVVAVYSEGTITRQQLGDYIRDELGGASLADLEGTEQAKLRFASGMLTRLVLDEVMLKDAEAKGLGQRDGVQRALRHLSEDENIADLAERVGARIEVSDAEIAAYYEKHRAKFKEVALAQVKELIRQLVIRAKARTAFDAYLDRIKAQATIERSFSLLDDAGADPGAALFSVNGKAFTVGQFRDELLRMTPEERGRCADPKMREQVLESYVTRTLLLDAASTVADEGLRKRLEQIRRMLLVSALWHEEVDQQVKVTDADVAQHYEEVKRAWTTLARARIAVAAVPLGKGDGERGKAAEAIARIRKAIAEGASFKAAGEQHQGDAPGLQIIEQTRWIGELDHLEDLIRPCEFHTRVFRTLTVGELSEPFRYGTQLFVVKVLEREEPRTPKQEEIGSLLRGELWSAKHDEAEERYLGGVLDRAKLKIHPDALAGMVRGQGTGDGGRGSTPALDGMGDGGRGTGDESARSSSP